MILSKGRTLFNHSTAISKLIFPIPQRFTKHIRPFHQTTRTMSLFQRYPGTEFAPLIRLLDDYSSQGGSGSFASVRAFTPKFDVRETKESYELHGELPGIEQKDVQIEFADPSTLVIKGHIERDYSSDRAHDSRGRVTGDVTEGNASHKATVEDEQDGEQQKDQGGKEGSQSTQVTKKHDQTPAKSGGGSKFWMSERSVGEFHRAFTFPSRVDQDAVKARLKDGILNVTVPKAPEYKGKRISVE